MGLVPCDVRTHSTAVMLRDFEISPKRVVHIGAHDGIEADIYDHFAAESVVWFECNPNVLPDLYTRLEGRKNHYVAPFCLWDKSDEELEFYFYRNEKDGASGLFDNEKMFDYIKDCPIVGKTTVRTISFNDWALCGDEVEIPWHNCDFLNIDVQGAELKVFQGASDLLKSPTLKYIWCEVSWDQVYKGGCLMEEIDEFLASWDFVRVHVRRDWEIHGDALYVRG